MKHSTYKYLDNKFFNWLMLTMPAWTWRLFSNEKA